MASLRYITNTGGSIPKNYVKELKKRLPETDIFLMYGLTEAFRSADSPWHAGVSRTAAERERPLRPQSPTIPAGFQVDDGM